MDPRTSSAIASILILTITQGRKNVGITVEDASKDLIRPGLVSVDSNTWSIKLYSYVILSRRKASRTKYNKKVSPL